MATISAAAAARRCDEALEELPNGSDYLEACRDFYRALGAGSERKSNLKTILRAGLEDARPRG